ncbi:DsbA family protein [Paracoccaceae bacterium]|nr:DsbA family protein [Paracoccaceae bacterium]
MVYKLIIASIWFLAFSSVSIAMDINNMTNADRELFQKEIRRYILENPDIIFEAADIVRKREAALEVQEDEELIQSNFKEIFYDNYSYVGGNPDGDITLVEFVDYKCGYCRKAAELVRELIAKDDNIRFVVKEFPILGEASLVSSKFAIAVKNIGGPEKYKVVHDILLALAAEPTEIYLRRIAKELELNPEELFEAMQSELVTQEIDQTGELAQKLQISGTPTFILGNQFLRGFVPLEILSKAIQSERTK